MNGAKVYNNTFYDMYRPLPNTGCPKAAIRNDDNFTVGGAGALEFRNNIVVHTSNTDYACGSVGFAAVAASFTNNLWFGSSATGTIVGTGPNANPLFVSTTPGAENFRVNLSSPAIDAGTPAVIGVVTDDHDVATATLTQTTRPIGGGFDIGAFER